MANVLVTGGAGFIGGNFVHYWNAKHPGDHVVVLDALTYAGNRSTLEGAPNASLVEGDIRDTDLVERLLREHDITTLVHFAAESHVDRSISGPDDFIDTNILGTNSLLKAARSVWLSGSGTILTFVNIALPTTGCERPARNRCRSRNEHEGGVSGTSRNCADILTIRREGLKADVYLRQGEIAS